MTLFDFVVVVFAAGAVINAWLHDGGLFDIPRRRLSDWLHSVDMPWADYAAILVTCRFCQRYHATFWLILVFYLPGLFLPGIWPVILKLPVYALAATQVLYWWEMVCHALCEWDGDNP